MAKVLLKLIAVLAFVFIAIKGYIYFKLNNEVAKVFSLIEMTGASASYSWISSSFDGSISIKGVAIEQPLMGINFNADAIRFKGPKLLDLFDFGRKLQQGEFPEEIIIGLDRGVLSFAEVDSRSDYSEKNNFFEEFEALACGELKSFQLSDFVAMGYSELVFDFQARADIDKESRRLKADLNMSFDDMYSFTVDTIFDDLNELQSAGGLPSFAEFEFNNQSYVETKNKYCAELSSSSVDEYITEHTKRIKNYMIDERLPLSEVALSAYRAYLTKPVSIKVTVSPTTSLQLHQLARYSISDIPAMLGLIVTFNDTEVVEIFDEKNSLKEGEVQEEKKELTVVEGYTFKPTAVKNLVNYARHGIRLTTKSGREYEGFIVSTSKDSFDIEYKVNRGKLTIPIKYSQIRTASVLR